MSGNLAITDTNGATAPNNTLTTTTGTALNVANTTIHADDLTFLSISAGSEWHPDQRHRAHQHGHRWQPHRHRYR